MKVCWPFLIPFCSFNLLITFSSLSLFFFSLLALYRCRNQLCHWLYPVASHKEFSSPKGQTRVYGCVRQIHSTYIKAGAKEPMQNSCSTFLIPSTEHSITLGIQQMGEMIELHGTALRLSYGSYSLRVFI